MTDQTQVPEGEPAPAQPAVKTRSEIARELFGNEYKGEVKTPEEIDLEEPKPVDAKADEVPPTEEEPTESGETPEEGETATEEGTGEMPIVAVSELLERFEIPQDQFDGLKMHFNVDGMPTEATIKELVDSYQLREAAEHRLEKAKDYQAKQGEAWTAKNQEIEAQFQIAAGLVRAQEANLQRDIKAVDPKLRDEDPAEWAARRQEFNQRQAEIDQAKVEIVNQYRAVDAARVQEQQTALNQFKADQTQLLLQKLPEWQDETKANAEKNKIAQYALNNGYLPQELDNLFDHRYLITLRKAMLYDESRGQVDTAKKRVATVPKVMKPGAPKPAEQRASERIAALHAKAKKSGTVEDAIAYRMAKSGVR